MINYIKKNEVLVPIGSSCSVASYLRQLGLRKEAFPFDWNVTPIEDAIELINNNFKYFLNEKSLIYLEPTKRLLFKENGIDFESSNDIITPVYCTNTNTLFVHDFSVNGKADLKEVKKKYHRRIKRLNKLLNNTNIKIIFIYDDSLPNEWQMEQYNKVNYTFKRINDIAKLDELKRDNSEIISLKDFIKKTKMRKIFFSIKRVLLK